MTMLPIGAPAPTPNGASVADAASTSSGDFAAVLALVAGGIVAAGNPSSDSDGALPEGAAPEATPSDLQTEAGGPGTEQANQPEAAALVAMPIPMRAVPPAGPSSPSLSRPAEYPAEGRPVGGRPVGSPPTVRAAVDASPVHGDAPLPPPFVAEVPDTAGTVPPSSPVETPRGEPAGEAAAVTVPVEHAVAEVLPPGRGRPAVNVPASSVAVDASPALHEIAPPPVPTEDAPKPSETDPIGVAAEDTAVAAAVVAEESPVVPENLEQARRVAHKPLPGGDVPASAPLSAAAVRTEAARPVDAQAPTPMAPPAVPEQIVSAVVPLHGRGDGRHEVTLELRPEDLGPIRVEVSVEQQTVHLTLHAAEPATGRLLSTALADLRAALADAGLRAGHLAVSPDGGGAPGRRTRPEPAPADRAPRHDSTTPEKLRLHRPNAAGRLDLLL